jgi:hypothetical protein
MYDAIREHEANVDFWIVRKKFRNDRHDMQAPENYGGRDHELAFRRGVLTCRSALGFADIFEYAPAGSDV